MAQSKLTPQEFIQSAFAPQIAVLCSEDADNICLKNNLRFVELLQPFSKTNSEAWITTPSGTAVPVKNFKVNFEDMNRKPPQPHEGKRILSEAVTRATWDQEISKVVSGLNGKVNMKITLQPTTHWFEEWKEIFLQIQYPSDHEFTKHYIAVIIVISAGSENPLEQMNKLSQYQHQQQHQNTTRLPKWFSPNILKYYLLLHDVEQIESAKADQVFEQMTSAYGSSLCYLLRINSRPIHQSEANMADPWRRYLWQRGLVEESGVSGNSETSSGTMTPREDVVGLPTHVSEGDSSESSEPFLHPLSPVVPPPDEKLDGVTDMIPLDMPILMNSQTLPSGSVAPQQHGSCLTASDIDRIKAFVDDFCIRILIPHVQKQIRHLNEVVTNRSRSKSLLSVTRRWLGGTKPSPSGNPVNSVFYSQEAMELQTRRLGDLCFMFGLFDLAYNAYYSAKNDFKSDQAWLYFAGAQEMAALASFMQNPSEYPKRYCEGSLHTYLNVCKVYNFAIRLTLLSTEVLKHCGDYGEAAMMFIKMTSEESDLLSALMLEQAAHCFINSKHPLPRKYAFHMTLAGHRFSKAGQRAHSLRAYKQAFQVYLDRGWILAEDHIHYTMGKQAFLLKLNLESLEATMRLIDQRAKKDAPTQQSATQQSAYMKELLNILDKCFKEELWTKENPVSLPVPILKGQDTKVLIGDPIQKFEDDGWLPASHFAFSDREENEPRWFALENEVLTAAQGPAMIFKPNLQKLTSATPNTHSHSVPVRERISLQVHFHNPLLISLTLNSIQPTYKYFDERGKPVENGSCLLFESVHGLTMAPESTETVILNMYPQELGSVVIKGISYQISLTPEVNSSSTVKERVSVEVQQDIVLKGPRLNSTLSEKSGVVYAKDERMNIKVISEMPKLSIAFNETPALLSCGELKHVETWLVNHGPQPLTNLFIGVSEPKNVIFSIDNPETEEFEMETSRLKHLKNAKKEVSATRVQKLSLPGGVLEPGGKIKGHLLLQAPHLPRDFDVELLFYYESSDSTPKNRYRLVRHLSSIYLYPSISLQVRSSQNMNLLPEVQRKSLPCHFSNLVFHLENKCEIENSDGNVDIVAINFNSYSFGIIPPLLRDPPSIDAHENCQFCLQLYYIQEKCKDDLLFSYIPVKNQKLPPCWWKFNLRERLKVSDLISDQVSSSNPNYEHSSSEEDQAKQRQLEFPKLDSVVSVVWKAQRGNEEIIGQHSLYLPNLEVPPEKGEKELTGEGEQLPVQIIYDGEDAGNASSPLSTQSSQQNFIKVSVQVPHQVLHNFKKEALCRISFHVTLYNCLGLSQMVKVRFSPSTQTNIDGAGQAQMSTTPEASWKMLSVGASTRILKLPAFQSKTIVVQSIVTAPGTYCVGAFSVMARSECGSEWVSQTSQSLTAVLVRTEAQTVMERHLTTELSSIQALSSFHS